MNQLNDLLRDAARYRWLRANFATFVEGEATVPEETSGGYFDRYLTPGELDSKIDAAIK